MRPASTPTELDHFCGCTLYAFVSVCPETALIPIRDTLVAVTALLASALASACSSSPPQPHAYVNASSLGSGGTMCSTTGQLLGIGTDPDPTNPNRVANGSGASVTCSVKASSGGFNLALNAETSQGNYPGSLTISGSVTAAAGGPADIAGTIVSTGTGTFEETDCTITLNANAPAGPVQPGRVWGTLSCPTATLQGKVDQFGNPITCNLSADLLFVDCSE